MTTKTPLYDDYEHLSPDAVLNAVESQGYEVNAQILALNSYENRVYQVGIEDSDPVIVKFYRPLRWSDEQILEEHRFSRFLQDKEIPVVAPLENQQKETLHQAEGYRFAVFPRCGGYSPEPGDLEQLYRLGMLLGRIHQCAQGKSFDTRESFSFERNFLQPVRFLLENSFIPDELKNYYVDVTGQLESKISLRLNDFKNFQMIKCHGDWHLGNILWRDESGGNIVDFDDCVNAPAVQDIWMMLSGDAKDQSVQLSEILEGYRQFNDFDLAELNIIESLRTLRMVFYTAWLAKRWEDPAFPMHFPWFNQLSYWQQHIRSLEEQIELIDAPALSVY